MRAHSLVFGNTDLREKYGVIVQKIERPFFAKLRPRKVEVPERSGAFDYGAKFRDELVLPVRCGTAALLTQADVRELIYELSFKNTITLWDEPDKYYVGRLYDGGKIERLVASMRTFTLSFICEPFAYGKTVEQAIGMHYVPAYSGSEKTPCRLQIANVGDAAATGVRITITRRKERF